MYNIYFNKRVLNISNPDKLIKNNPNSIYLNSPAEEDLVQLPEFFEKSVHMSNLVVAAHPSDVETKFNTICSAFTQINAAGGLVENEKGEYLLIFRNGLWDLPKGKQEEGEDISVTALREVEEECGITGLELKDLICITRHTYRMNGEFILKHTYWYKMSHTGDCNLVPQTEEGIDQVKWVAKENLASYIHNTYPSIKELFTSLDTTLCHPRTKTR